MPTLKRLVVRVLGNVKLYHYLKKGSISSTNPLPLSNQAKTKQRSSFGTVDYVKLFIVNNAGVKP